jgi:type III restriction enzyme
LIDDPILNSPYRMPGQHFRFDDEGITPQIVRQRRSSEYFVPIAPTKSKQLSLESSWGYERRRPNEFINQVRSKIDAWRGSDYAGATSVSKMLLDYWSLADRSRPLFFCQVEAVETAIYLTEVAPRHEPWIGSKLAEINRDFSDGLPRLAHKMATGSGKTVVMAMLIAWQGLNKLTAPQDPRFADAFLIVAPGLTIRDRLRVLRPNAPDNYYLARDVVRPEWLERMSALSIEIVNYHAFGQRDRMEGSKLTKAVLSGPDGPRDQFRETPEEVARRVLRPLGTKRSIIVINDEAHHCYRDKPIDREGLRGDEAQEAKRNAEAARLWLNGLLAVSRRVAIRRVFDLSATPAWLRGSGFAEGEIFPWTVSDFSLIDAIESGIVKIPRVPVSDDASGVGVPMFRDLWSRVKDDLPKRGRSGNAGNPDDIPAPLEAALRTLYADYEKRFAARAELGDAAPPVFIVICSNTAVSKMIADWIGGYEAPDGTLVSGHLPLFANADDGAWAETRRTILIDSAQIESGEPLSSDFKAAARREIEEFKREYERRYPGRTSDALDDGDVLREVLNTVGKPGKLGAEIRCVVSVSMLTEGWDANTVTHVLGVRAFGTQLLCEQVVGRGLRRTSYETDPDGRFSPEYAEVYGIPFTFVPTSGSSVPKPERAGPTHIRALPERAGLAIAFPRVDAYRWHFAEDRIAVRFGDESRMILDPNRFPTLTELDPIVGSAAVHDLDAFRSKRIGEIIFAVAQTLLERYLCDENGAQRPWLFRQAADAVRQYVEGGWVTTPGNTFVQMLLFAGYRNEAAERVYQGIVAAQSDGVAVAEAQRIYPRLRGFDPIGSTSSIAFDTTKPTYKAVRSHVNRVVCDSGWEATVAELLEHAPEVISYVKNQGLGFSIPYVFYGQPHRYEPDFLVRWRPAPHEEPLTVVLEVSGRDDPMKAAKVGAATTLWIPAVNNLHEFGRWIYVDVRDRQRTVEILREQVGRDTRRALV